MLRAVTFALLVLLYIPVQAMSLQDQRCMANVIYHEANTESVVAQRAVYDVVKHRAKAKKKTVCQVVHEKKAFSWVDVKQMLPYNGEMKQLLREVEVVGPVLISENYQYFFQKRLNPKWAKKMKCVVLESHKFCKEE